MKLFDYIKLGFGFYIGYEIARLLDKGIGETYKQFESRVKKGY